MWKNLSSTKINIINIFKSNDTKKIYLIIFIISFLLGSIASVGASLLTEIRGGGDGWLDIASNIFHYGEYSFIKGGEFSSFRPPLYPLILSLTYYTKDQLLIITIIHIFIFSLTSVIIYITGFSVRNTQKTGLISRLYGDYR